MYIMVQCYSNEIERSKYLIIIRNIVRIMLFYPEGMITLPYPGGVNFFRRVINFFHGKINVRPDSIMKMSIAYLQKSGND